MLRSFDVLPTLATGVSISIEQVATAPASAQGEPFARIQQLAQIPGSQGDFAVLDTRGVVWLWDGATFAQNPLLDLRGTSDFLVTGAENGLRSIAFHPDFATPGASGHGKLYVAYSAQTGAATEGSEQFSFDNSANPNVGTVFQDVVVEYTAPNLTSIDPSTGRELMRIDQPFGNHNFGSLEFDPDLTPDMDGYGLLYLTTGDGGSGGDPLGLAGRLDMILGKVLRIDPLATDTDPYSIPSDNPFVGTAGALDEIYAYGLRNPQNLSFDNGVGYIGEIGQNSVEEINILVAGAHYGWNDREGTFAFDPSTGQVDDLPEASDDFQYPFTQYDHASTALPNAGTGGGLVYRGTDVPALTDSYVFVDIASGDVFFTPIGQLGAAFADGRIAPEETRLPQLVGVVDDAGTPTNFIEIAGSPARGNRVDLRLEQTADGEIYAFSKTNGDIFRFVAAPQTVGPAVIDGTDEDNDLFGSNLPDLLRGKDGADQIAGRRGNDTIFGGQGADTLEGGRGSDEVRGGLGADLLVGGRGDDTLIGANGADTLRGGFGNDVLTGGAGLNEVRGGPGIDTLDVSDLGVPFMSQGQVFGDIGIVFDFRDGIVTTFGTDVTTFQGIERVIGTDGTDHFRGSAASERFEGGGEFLVEQFLQDADGEFFGAQADVVELPGTQDSWVFQGQADDFTAARAAGVDEMIGIEFLRFRGDDTTVATSDLDFV